MHLYEWSKHQFGCVSKNHYITNNLFEAFTAWILDARTLTTVELVEKIRIKVMMKFEQRRNLANKRKGQLVPYEERYIEDINRKLGVYGL